MREETIVSDEILIQAAFRGDETAAAHLYHRYADLVFRISCRIVLDRVLAKDCAQDVWLKVFRYQKRYQAGSSFRAWISTIAVRSAIDTARKRARRRAAPMEETFLEAPDPHVDSIRNIMDEEKIEAAILAALDRLSALQRAAFILRHFEDQPYAVIAEMLECTEGTVKTHVHRAALALRKRLSPFFQHWEAGSCVKNT